MHRLLALIKIAVCEYFPQLAHNIGFVFIIHSAIGVVPIAQQAESDEIGLLPFNLGLCILTAELAELRGGNVFAVLFLHLQFNRQTMAIPARHVGRVKASQDFAFDDYVLENFVYRVANMNIAIGIGWAVVQNKLGAAFCSLTDFLIKFFFLPNFKHARFTLGKIATHRERSIG